MFSMRRFASRAFSSTPLRADVARLTVVGRVGSELQPTVAKTGRTYLRYALAVSTGRDETSWFNINVFDDQAIDFMTTYLSKGATVFVEADARMQRYETEQGEPRQNLSLIQESISPIIWKTKAAAAAEAEAQNTSHPDATA